MSLAQAQQEAWDAVKALEGVAATYDGSRSITAVQRHTADDAAVVSESRHRSPVMQVSVDNDSTTGIAADEFVSGKTITLSPRASATARDFRMSRIVKQNAVFVTYEVH